MKKYIFVIIITLISTVSIYCSQAMQNYSMPSNLNLDEIGQKIYFNECSSLEERIISWNKGEEFLSLGIGHFIWFPKDYNGPYQETFPAFVDLVKEKRPEIIPLWLAQMNPIIAPWNSREEFLTVKDSSDVTELRQFLLATMDLQTLIMVNRANTSLPEILKSVSFWKRWSLKNKFFAVAHSPNGMFAIIDYINFKGEGASQKEKYNGKGWGLLQVLEEMRNVNAGPEAIREFARAADTVLTRRVLNSPPERNESKWLQGWKNRIRTYLEF